jgi:hypothetical protein
MATKTVIQAGLELNGQPISAFYLAQTAARMFDAEITEAVDSANGVWNVEVSRFLAIALEAEGLIEQELRVGSDVYKLVAEMP